MGNESSSVSNCPSIYTQLRQMSKSKQVCFLEWASTKGIRSGFEEGSATDCDNKSEQTGGYRSKGKRCSSHRSLHRSSHRSSRRTKKRRGTKRQVR
jgi:hypothetical protein